jgi:hypothetical protein
MSSGRLEGWLEVGSRMGLVILAIFVVALPCSAQRVDDRARARAAFSAAEAAFEIGAYDDALTHFRRALELAPTDVVRFNIAVCLERLGRLRESRDAYRALAESEMLPDRERARALAAAGELEPQLGLLIIDHPVGAEVRIDGRWTCRVPCREPIEPGSHQLALVGALAGEQVEVPAGTVTVSLTPLPEAPSEIVLGAPDRPAEGRDLTPLFWTGAGLSGLALGSAIYFGVRTEDLRAQFTATPTEELRADGLLHRDLTNASLVVLGLGLTLVVVDVIWWWLEQPRGRSAASLRRIELRF